MNDISVNDLGMGSAYFKYSIMVMGPFSEVAPILDYLVDDMGFQFLREFYYYQVHAFCRIFQFKDEIVAADFKLRFG